jgi:hypothetical protein
MAVNVDPSALDVQQQQALKTFARGGGTVLSGPPGWKIPEPRKGQVALDQKELDQIDDIWKGINSMIGRANLGVRLFNVAGMLSSVCADAAGKTIVVELVNYTDYPIESVTVHVLGKYSQAQLLAPGAAPRKLDVYEAEDGAGVDIPVVSAAAALVLQ